MTCHLSLLATLVLVALLGLSIPAWAVDLTSRVVGLADGDTITILTA